LPVVRSQSATRHLSNEQFNFNELSTDSVHKNSNYINLFGNNDREMSIREIQFHDKLEEMKRIENLNSSILDEIDKKKYVMFQEVLVKPRNKHIIRSLSKYSKHENLSVERIARTRSPFKRNLNRPPLPRTSVKRNRNSPTIDLGPDWVYLTETKDENFRWNDISNKQLADKVRMSIQEVDEVLRINEYNDINKSPNSKSASKTEDTFTPSPRASFKRFRELLKTNNLVVSDKNEILRLKSSQNKELLTGSKMLVTISHFVLLTLNLFFYKLYYTELTAKAKLKKNIQSQKCQFHLI
jgi:hypothetical protein